MSEETKLYKHALLNKPYQKLFETHKDILHSFMEIETNTANNPRNDLYECYLHVLANFHSYLSSAAAFNLSLVKTVIHPEDKTSRLKGLGDGIFFSPYNVVWLEDFAVDKNNDKCVFFGLYIKNPHGLQIDSTTDHWVGFPGYSVDGDFTFGNYFYSFFAANDRLVCRDHTAQEMVIVSPYLSDHYINSVVPVESRALYKTAVASDISSDIASYVRFCRFLSVKNIVVQSHGMSLKKSHLRHLHNKGITYHTLSVVKPGKQYNPSCSDGDSRPTPLHMCRGHLRTYTEEKPLFGKYPGTFYIPAHVKGDIQNGVSLKQYKIKAEQ